MKRRPQKWTEFEMMEAVRMRADGMSFTTIGAELDRGAQSVEDKLRYLKARTLESAKLVAAGRCPRTENHFLNMVTAAPSLRPEQIEARDANYRAMASQDLTATICGDPPAGRSALDQRQKDRAS